ncbi:MAG: DMT family transporter [Polyangiales bacterium]
MAGLVYLVLLGMTAPDPLGALLMIASGVGWGVYSLRGTGSIVPAAATAGNFARALALAVAGLFVSSDALHASTRGVGLAAISGALSSGLGYVLWYVALRGLTATRAAIVQLAVPVIAAAAGILVLGEAPSGRLAIACTMILGGVGGAVLARGRQASLDPCEDLSER